MCPPLGGSEDECRTRARGGVALAIRRLRPEVQLPAYQTDGAAGLDLQAWPQDGVDTRKLVEWKNGFLDAEIRRYDLVWRTPPHTALVG